nr:wd repeat domain-containing protein 83 [Quercus suber]
MFGSTVSFNEYKSQKWRWWWGCELDGGGIDDVKDLLLVVEADRRRRRAPIQAVELRSSPPSESCVPRDFWRNLNDLTIIVSRTASRSLPALKRKKERDERIGSSREGSKCVESCGKDRTIRLWNPHRGIHIKTYKSHAREVRDVHVTPDNSKLCSCGGDRQIFYWDVSTGRVIRKFRGHDGEVNAVKFNEYSSVIVSAGYDQSLRAWDCRSHSTEPIQIIDSFSDSVMSVNAVKFNEYSSVIVSAGYDQSLRAWDCRSHSTEPIQIIDSFSDSVMSVCLTKSEIIGGSVDGTVRTFDIRIGREISDNLGQPVNCISMSNDGNCILASCLDSTLRLLDRTSGELLQEYKGHTCKSYKLDCCLTNTDAHVTGGSEDGFIYFWDLVDASVVSSFRAHSSVVTSVSYHPKDSCMITASVDGTIRVWKT